MSCKSVKPRQVLVLSGFEPFQEVMTQVLGMTGVKLGAAVKVKNLSELQIAAHGQTFHAIVSDFALEDVRGQALLEVLESVFPGLRVLFICDLACWEKELIEADKRGHSFIDRNDFLNDAAMLASAYLSVEQECAFAY